LIYKDYYSQTGRQRAKRKFVSLQSPIILPFGRTFVFNHQNLPAMRPIKIVIAIALLLTGCYSSKNLLKNGYYDDAIYKSVRKLTKNPQKAKEIAVLTEALRIANDRDKERIEFLKKSGQPDIWDEVFSLYSQLKYRQDVVKTLPLAVQNTIGFKPVDYDNDVLEAKRKAAEYFYSRALSLLAKNDKYAAREAYDNLLRVKDYYPNYKDADNQLALALSLGTTHVLFKMSNAAPVVMPAGFEEELLKISIQELDTRWVNFDSREVAGRTYDNVVLLTLRNIDVTPERIHERTWVESKEVEDGWKYLLDANGNVKKDTAGNDIKVKKYKTISCQLLETSMNKSAIVTGVLDFYDNTNRQLLKSEPINAQSDFNYLFVVAHGDLNALSNETKQKIGPPKPFPSNMEMIMMSNSILKDVAKSLIRGDMYLFK
jgi:hypothetical protein